MQMGTRNQRSSLAAFVNGFSSVVESGRRSADKKPNRRRRLRVEKLAQRTLLAADWSNPDEAADVNDDDRVSALDALLVINHLNKEEASGEPITEESNPLLGRDFYPDVNADGRVTALDALRVVNSIGAGEDTGNASGPDITFSSITGGIELGLPDFTVVVENVGDRIVIGGVAQLENVLISVSIPEANIDSPDLAGAIPPSATTAEIALVRFGPDILTVPDGVYDLRFTVALNQTAQDSDLSNNTRTYSDALIVNNGQFTVELNEFVIGDGGTNDGGTNDGGTNDGGTNDGGTNDGGTNDGGTNDGGTNDGGTNDGGTNDGANTPRAG